MKKYLSTILFLSVFLISANTWAAPRNYLAKSTTQERLEALLISKQQWVSYPDYADRTGWNKLMGKHKKRFIKRGEQQLNYKWQVITATDYLAYERTGDRSVMQNPNSANINALTDLVLAELAEGNGRFIDQIINGVFYHSERTSWVLSAHLPLQLSKRTLPEHTDAVIDLGSADVGALLAWTYYFFHSEFDKINPTISKRLYHELEQKIILPYRNENRYWWMGFNLAPDGLVNNWNPWINCNVLQCIALLENNPEQFASDVYKTMLSVDKFINYVQSDGACEEGPSYWAHAAGKLYDYLEVLAWITNDNISLFGNEMIKNMGEYIVKSYVGNDWVVNFADASARFSSDAPLIYRYGNAIGSADMKQFATYLIKEKKKNPLHAGSDLSDFLRKMESLKYAPRIEKSTSHLPYNEVTVYPNTEFYYFRNKQRLFLAVKGGYNAESHNHNDAGTFSLWLNETPIIIDAGVGTYTRQTFGKERYSIWTMRSNYHNIPQINGEEQQFGKNYKATDIRINEKRKSISLNIAKAYPDVAQTISWQRGYQLKKDKLIITDSYQLKDANEPNQIHFMLWGKVDLEKGKVSLDVNANKMELLYNSNQFSAHIDTIPLPDTRLSKVWGEEIYRLTLKARTINKKGNYRYVIRKQ